jgi:pentose-5-phosphate-3-epimerase
MVEIIPAVLPKSFEGLEHGLGRLHTVAPLVQIDLVGTNVLEGHYALPFWEEFDFECDIMLTNPAGEVQTCIDAGASRIVVHAEAITAKEALTMLQQMRGGEIPTVVGVALRSHDTPDALSPFDGLYDFVQVMGIDTIGKQGEPADPHGKELELIKALRAEYPELVIQVDGAAASHVQELVAAGANRLVIGSAIVNASNPEEAYKTLYTEANAY